MNSTPLLLALIGHLVGDYLLQNDWMALNKKKLYGGPNCAIHALIWTCAVMGFAGWFEYTSRCVWVFAILLLTHYWQDRTNIIAWWMDLIGQKQFRTGICAPWSIIVVDNVWHILTIWAVWRFVV